MPQSCEKQSSCGAAGSAQQRLPVPKHARLSSAGGEQLSDLCRASPSRMAIASQKTDVPVLNLGEVRKQPIVDLERGGPCRRDREEFGVPRFDPSAGTNVHDEPRSVRYAAEVRGFPDKATVHALAPWGVGLLALLITGWEIGVPGLWYDEVVTLTMAERSWSSMFAVLGRIDVVHGAYYSLMHLWMDVFPYTPSILRLPSVILVSATAVVLMKMGVRKWNLMAGIVAALVFIGIPRSLWMATQARSYALAAFTITFAIYLFVVALEKNQRRHWVGFGTVMALAVWAFLYNILLLPVLVVVALLQRPASDSGHLRRAWVAIAAVVAASLPLVLLAVSQSGQIGWIKQTTVKRALTAPYYAFFDGTSSIVAVGGWVILVVVSGAMLGWLTFRTPRNGSVSGGALSPRAVFTLILGWLALPGAALLTAGAFMSLYYDTYLVISVPALALLIGGGVAAAGSRRWQGAVVVALIAILAYQPWGFFREPNSKSDILNVVALIAKHSRPGDDVLFVEGGDWDTRQLKYAYPGAFRGLRDLTLEQDVEASLDFFGTSRNLDQVGPELDEVKRLLVVANNPDRPKSQLASDLQTLTAAGLQISNEDSTGKWRVIVLER